MLRETLEPVTTIRFSSNPASVSTTNHNGSVPWPGTYIGPSNDTVLSSYLKYCEFISPPFDLLQVLSRGVSQDDTQRQWLGLKPQPDDSGASERVRRTEAVLYTIKELFSGSWRFNAVAAPTIKGENNVTHMNLVGSVVNEDSTSYHRPMAVGNYPVGYVVPHYILTPNISTGVSWTPSGPYTHPASPKRYAHTNLTALQAQVNSGGFDTWATFPHNTFSNFSFEMYDELSVKQISYQVRCFISDTRYNVWRDRLYSVVVRPRWVVTPVLTPDGTPRNTYDVCKFYLDIEWTNHYDIARYFTQSNWFQNVPQVGDKTYSSYDHSYLLGNPLTVESDGVEGLLRHSLLDDAPGRRSYHLVKETKTVLNALLPDIYPGVFYSSKSAVDSYLDELASNHLETLSDLDDIKGFIEPVQGFTKLCGRIKAKDPFGTLVAMLDLLSSAKLLWEFGISPTLADANQAAERAGPILEKYRNGYYFKPRTVNGKFIHTLSPEYTPYGPLTVVYRSKVRLSLDPNSLLAALLPIKSFGLLPTLSNLWDLLPWSFVIDWFLNIGDRLENVDSSAIMLALDVAYSVHSVSINIPFGDSLLNQYDLRKVGTGEWESDVQPDPGMKLYVRSVMSRVPVLTYSTIDFDQAGGVPDWGTFASLIYKALRKN